MNPAQYCMTSVAPTVAAVLGLPALAQATGAPIPDILADLRGAPRLALLAPDALGLFSFQHFAADMPFLRARCQERMVILRAVLPSITPVNFCTMITGCALAGHGVSSREMTPRCPTLFDLLAQAGRVGAGCGRPGYTGAQLLARLAQLDGTAALPDDAATEEVVLRLARTARPDFIIAQIGGTDDHFHRFGPRSESARPKVCEMDQRLERMCAALTGLGYAVIILADHGQHETGDRAHPGSHGGEADEDCLVPCTWLG